MFSRLIRLFNNKDHVTAVNHFLAALLIAIAAVETMTQQ